MPVSELNKEKGTETFIDSSNTPQGPPIHTVTVFANPFLPDKPSPSAPGVLAVSPGAAVPSEGAWSTLYFLPGTHDIGANFQVHANRTYYIPGGGKTY